MFKSSQKLLSSKYFWTTVFLTFLSLLLAYSTYYFYQKYTHKINQLDLANLSIKNLEDQIQILRTEQLPSTNFNALELADSSDWDIKTDQLFNISYKCPPKWQCTNSTGDIYINGPLEYGTLSISIRRMDNKEFKHPKYTSINTWFEDLYNREQKAIDRGFQYGSWPFYAYYDYKNMTDGVLNGNKYVMFTQTSASTAEILINKGAYVYFITAYPNAKYSQKTVKTIVSSIQFN